MWTPWRLSCFFPSHWHNEHIPGALLTNCTFRKKRNSNESKYAYATSIHYCNTYYSRNMNNSKALRSSTVKEDYTVFLGMKKGGFEAIKDSGRWPLFKLSLKLSKARYLIPKHIQGFSVVPGYIDAYLHNVSAPDYLFGDTLKRWVDTCYMQRYDMNLFQKSGFSVRASFK